MKTTRLISALLLVLAVAAPGVRAATAPNKVQNAVASQEQLDKSAASSQKKIDAVSAGTQDMLNQYLSITQQTDELRAYDEQLQQITQAQQDSMNSLGTQSSQVEQVKQGFVPLMLQMVDSLAQFVKLDIPYRQDERLARVQEVRTAISNPTVPVTDSFQRLVQAYKDEIAAGKSVESYRGEINGGGKALTVNFLRIGHLALVYQTLDKSETGYWDKQKRAWQASNDYRDAVNRAIAVASKQAPPDLMEVPVEAPEVGK